AADVDVAFRRRARGHGGGRVAVAVAVLVAVEVGRIRGGAAVARLDDRERDLVLSAGEDVAAALDDVQEEVLGLLEVAGPGARVAALEAVLPGGGDLRRRDRRRRGAGAAVGAGDERIAVPQRDRVVAAVARRD